MTQKQISTLRHFIDRPKMYVAAADKQLVVPFLTGLETGDGDLQLTSKISELVERKSGIKGSALGWPEQIQNYANENGVEWFVALRHLVEEIIGQSAK